MAQTLGNFLNNLETKEFFQSVAFLENGDFALSKELWDKSTSVPVKNTKILFNKDDCVISECQFLSKNSNELWFLRSPNGCLYGSTSNKRGIKLTRAEVPEPLLTAIINKVTSIVPTYREDSNKTMKREITDHFNRVYADKLVARGRIPGQKRKISSFSLDTSTPDTILTAGIEIAKDWSEEKKIRLINKMIEVEREEAPGPEVPNVEQDTGNILPRPGTSQSQIM